MKKSATRRPAQRPATPRRRQGQSVVEYMLGISVIVIAVAIGFLAIGDATRDVFDNVRRTVQLPYP